MGPEYNRCSTQTYIYLRFPPRTNIFHSSGLGPTAATWNCTCRQIADNRRNTTGCTPSQPRDCRPGFDSLNFRLPLPLLFLQLPWAVRRVCHNAKAVQQAPTPLGKSPRPAPTRPPRRAHASSSAGRALALEARCVALRDAQRGQCVARETDA